MQAYTVTSFPWFLLLGFNILIQATFVYFIADLVFEGQAAASALNVAAAAGAAGAVPPAALGATGAADDAMVDFVSSYINSYIVELSLATGAAAASAATEVRDALAAAAAVATTSTTTSTAAAAAAAATIAPSLLNTTTADLAAGAAVEFSACAGNTSLLRLAAVVTLTCYCYGELWETVGMLRWILGMATTPTTERLQVVRDPESHALTGVVSGLSSGYKLFATLAVVLPKLALGATLWWYGASYVAMSVDNAELILNTVAVLFVLEIDDQMYAVTVPESMRRVIAALPPVAPTAGGEEGDDGDDVDCAACGNICGQWFNMGVIAGMSAAVLKNQC